VKSDILLLGLGSIVMFMFAANFRSYVQATGNRTVFGELTEAASLVECHVKGITTHGRS
jgi:hypothetical protein